MTQKKKKFVKENKDGELLGIVRADELETKKIKIFFVLQEK